MDSWIIGGDFNNLETLEDQQGRGIDFEGIAHGEQSTWESFLFAIGDRDSQREPLLGDGQAALISHGVFETRGWQAYKEIGQISCLGD